MKLFSYFGTNLVKRKWKKKKEKNSLTLYTYKSL